MRGLECQAKASEFNLRDEMQALKDWMQGTEANRFSRYSEENRENSSSVTFMFPVKEEIQLFAMSEGLMSGLRRLAGQFGMALW